MAFERAPQPGKHEPVFTARNNGTTALLKKGFFKDLPRSVKEQFGMAPALHREAVKEEEQAGLQREAAKDEEREEESREVVQQKPVVEQPIARREAPQAPPQFTHEAVVSYDARGKKTIEALPVGLDGVQRYRVTRDVRPDARTPPEGSRDAAKSEEREEDSGVELPMQTKLRVSSPDDPAEREADEMADRVMTMPLQREAVSREVAKDEEREEVSREAAKEEEREEVSREAAKDEKPEEVTREANEDEIQTKCADCEAEEKDTLNREGVQREAAKSEEREDEEEIVSAKLQRKGDMSGATVDAGTAAQINSVRNSGGQPLAPGDRAFFEERMDADFSNVRVHTNAAANESASAVQARAFTLGGDIVFNQGEYKPEASDGKRLLAHELTHTIQQGAAVSRSVRRKYQGAARSLLQRRGGRPRSQPAAATQSRGAPQTETESGAGFLVKKALDAAVWIIDQIPDAWFMPAAALGLVFKHGMRGFLQKLADSGGDRVLTVIANVARAVASFEFVKNYVTGFLKGFFVDGLWGTIEFLWEIIKLPYTLTRFAWNVVSSLGDVNIGAVLQSIANGASGAANWIGNNGRAILTEIKDKALSGNVGNLADTLQGMYRSVTAFVQRGGARLAEVMLEFFGQRSDRLGATLGTVAGTTAGNVTFEVAATALTAGGAQGLLRLRGPVGAALRWMAATGRRALDAAGDVYRTVRGLYSSLKSSVLAYLGRFSGMLRTKLDEMIEGVMRFFESLMARVRRGPRAADDAADAAGDGRRAAGAAEDARRPGGRDRGPDGPDFSISDERRFQARARQPAHTVAELTEWMKETNIPDEIRIASAQFDRAKGQILLVRPTAEATRLFRRGEMRPGMLAEGMNGAFYFDPVTKKPTILLSSATDRRQQAETLVHELTHFVTRSGSVLDNTFGLGASAAADELRRVRKLANEFFSFKMGAEYARTNPGIIRFTNHERLLKLSDKDILDSIVRIYRLGDIKEPQFEAIIHAYKNLR